MDLGSVGLGNATRNPVGALAQSTVPDEAAEYQVRKGNQTTAPGKKMTPKSEAHHPPN